MFYNCYAFVFSDHVYIINELPNLKYFDVRKNICSEYVQDMHISKFCEKLNMDSATPTLELVLGGLLLALVFRAAMLVFAAELCDCLARFQGCSDCHDPKLLVHSRSTTRDVYSQVSDARWTIVVCLL